MSKIPEDLAAALADRYQLVEPVGRGGMATVFRAVDLKHRRDVAVKVLRTELSVTIGAERFLREIEIAAQLQHPHILMLIDSGEAEETLYYVMPFVGGGSLRSVISAKRLNLDDTLSVIRPVADALCYAHKQGVVHRDIKPENILFNGEYPTVGDFGIAKAISTAGHEVLTRTGFPLGTVGYMSPEQAAGSTDLGPASDVYSLACVVYEMLVGAIPGVWLSDEDSDVGRLADIDPGHRNVIDSLPGSVEKAIARALARRPAQRFETPLEFLAALEGKIEVTRRFNDTQVQEIIENAAEGQFANPTADGNLTVGAIEAIAADVGLSPRRVHEAILELDARENLPEAPVGFLNLRSNVEIDATLPREVSPEQYGDLLEEIRVQFGEVGRVNETMGKALSWNSSSYQNSLTGTGRLIHISVSPKNGETRMRITETAGAHHAFLLFGAGLGGTMLAAAVGEFLGLAGRELIPLGAATVAASYGLGRAGLMYFVKNRYRKLRGLLKKLAGMIEVG